MATAHTLPEPHTRGAYAGDGECPECNTLCRCGNPAMPGTHICDWCDSQADEPPHLGHFTRLTGDWFCDTCNSPYCDLA